MRSSRPMLRAASTLVASAAVAVGLLPATAQAADRSAPTRPGPLTVQSVSQTGAVVDFGRSRDRSGAVSYRILANGKGVGRSRRTSDVAVRLRCGTTYFVTAVAVDSSGNRSAASPGANLRTRACLDQTAPRRPGSLVERRVTSGSVRLVWDLARDPGHGPVPNYLVYRNGVVLGGATTTAFTARNLRPDTAYTFTVRARDRAGNLSRPARRVVRTELPPQATGDVRAFLLHSDGRSFADAQAHYRQLDWVYPTFFSLTQAGDVTGTGQPHVTAWLQQRGIEVLPRFHTEDPVAIEAIASDPAVRARAVAAVARVVVAGGYDGANLDLEMNMPTSGIGNLTVAERWDRLRNGYSLFVEEVAAALEESGSLLSVAVSPNWCSSVDRTTRATLYCTDSGSTSTRRPRAYLFDYERIAAAADEVWVMAWGLHWSTSDPGPLADLRWLRAVTDYYADLFADAPDSRAKLTLGTNLYGMDWSYRVVRTDHVAMPGGTIPAAPACGAVTPNARARYSYEGTVESGTLTVDWVCLTRFAATEEHERLVARRHEFTTDRYDTESGEHVLSSADPVVPGAIREIWFTDARSVDARARLATDAGWRLGFWRLGAEDQAIWDLTSLEGLRP